MSMYAATSPEHFTEAIRLGIDEFSRAKREKVTEGELQRAKDQLKVSIMLSLESTSARMSNLARQEIFFHRQFTLDEIIERIDRVTAEDIQRVAGYIFDGSEMAVTALGPLDSIDIDKLQLTC
jgi:predicted Zn-dependent peptidase